MTENLTEENRNLDVILMNQTGRNQQIERGKDNDEDQKSTQSRPFIKYSIFNIPTVGWITPLLFKGAQSPLQQYDLYDLPDLFKANMVADYLIPFWDAIQVRKKSNAKTKKLTPSLFSIVLKKFGWTIFATIVFQGLSVACILTIPTFLQQILYFLTSPTIVPGVGVVFDPKSKLFMQSGVGLSILLTLLQIGSVFFQNTSTQLGNALQVDFKTLLIGAVYEKSLKLSQASSRKFTQGQILNTINVDVEKVSAIFLQLASLTAAPIQVAVSLILLSDLIGVAVWGGFGVIFGILTLQILVIGFLAGYQKSFLQGGDKRLKLLREVLYGIKIIKFRVLESFFATRLSNIRANQLSILKKYYVVQAYFVGLIQIAPIAMPIVGFLVYAAINGDITPATIFPALSLFQGLFQPILTIPQSLTATVVAIVSWRRIIEILEAEEGEDIDEPLNQNDELGSLVVENLDLQWESVQKNEKNDIGSPIVPQKSKPWFSNKNKRKMDNDMKENEGDSVQIATPFKISSISMAISPGSKVAIVGPVGCGKSSLLSGLIKEMPKLGGSITLKGRVAYCNQQPWILTDTIEGNIVFNQPYNKKKLDEVIAVCGLDKDLQLFPAGVKTEIGEKGVNLSGGQKARVALARALYFSPDLLLLDDPMSALDAQVGAFVFEKAIKEYAASKTVLLVTHQLLLLPEADWVIVMDRGKISQQGTYQDLIADKSGTLALMMKDYKVNESDESNDKNNVKSLTKSNVRDESNEKKADAARGGIIVEEERKAGSVSLSVFWHYFQQCGGITFVAIVIFSALLNAGTQVMTNLWLSWWTSNKYNLGLTWYMRGYGILGLAQFAFALMINTVFLSGCFKAAKYYHPTALSALFRAPIGFFDSQPIGRLLNRMSKDIESIDQNLWILMFLSTIAVSGAFASLCFLCYVDQRMIALAVPLVILYFFILKYYQRSNIEFKRFESNNRSPLYAHVSETLAGISTVKAFAVERDFVRKQRRLMDESNIPTFLRLMAAVWVNMRLGVLSSLLTLLLCLLGTSSSLEPALIGVSLTYAIGFAGQLGLLLFASSQLENEFNSVERLKVFCEDLPKEASDRLESDPAPSQWPIQGAIEFENVSLSYPSRPNVLILKQLSFKVKAGEKVGIIGRTGSGKSTIMTALFRLVELVEGAILIDDKDISKIGLATLRKGIQIIPQEPVLFTGTIRENLDMEGLYPDEAVWQVLDRIGMKEYVESLGEEKLLAPVTENGANLSVGQRQLICLGRAILMKPRILIMDEATASVDGEADKLIQKSIKTYFANTTVLSIAHRLNTIADFDRVLVLQDGEMIEFASPYELLSRSDSLFSQLAEATGVANAALLRQIALEKHNSL